jgi:hypothetical protein
VVVTIIFCTFCSNLYQDIRRNKALASSLLDKKSILEIGLSIFLLLLLITLSLHITHAQPGTNKNAIIFWGVHIYNSHDIWGCGDWNLWASVGNAPEWPPLTVILDYCVDTDNTYGVIPLVAIVTEYPTNQRPTIWLYGYEEDWLFNDYLLFTVFEPFNPPGGRMPLILPSGTIKGVSYHIPDYWTGFDMIDCHSSLGQYLQICQLPPGPYYKWADQDFWIYGVPPDPDIGP